MFPTLDSALLGKEIPLEIREALVLLNIPYRGFDDQLHTGQLIVHHTLANEVTAIFEEIARAGFPIEKMVPVVCYDWSDDASMADNNSSGFNYRCAVGKTQLSQHAYGRAIDVNPLQNPYVKGDQVLPPGADYDSLVVGTLLEQGPVVVAFERHGWTWGGRWTTLKDWQHFEKPASASGA
jgi:peptidoglycan L-alanyl-D-glutamate endopeptidase CwlK